MPSSLPDGLGDIGGNGSVGVRRGPLLAADPLRATSRTPKEGQQRWAGIKLALLVRAQPVTPQLAGFSGQAVRSGGGFAHLAIVRHRGLGTGGERVQARPCLTVARKLTRTALGVTLGGQR